MANTTKQVTLFSQSSQSVKYFLDVVVLLELVDESEHFRGLLFGQFCRDGADVFVLCGKRCDAPRFEGFLQFAEVGEGAADDELWLSLLASALTHLLETMIYEVELEIILVDARGVEAEHTHFLKEEADTAVRGEVATALRHRASDLCDGAGGIVGRGLHQ